MKKIIAISGTHGTGKSDLAYNLCIFLKRKGKSVIVLDELIRESPFKINQEASDSTQSWTICKQIVRELELMEKYDYIITDRSVLDAYCYGKALDQEGTWNTCVYLDVFLKEHIHKYYKKLYLLDMDSFNFNIEDGVRDTDDAFRTAVFSNLQDTFYELGVRHTLIKNVQEIYSDFTDQ